MSDNELEAQDRADEKKSELDDLKAHFALCLQIFQRIAEDSGLDMKNCKFEVTASGITAAVPLQAMFDKWNEMVK